MRFGKTDISWMEPYRQSFGLTDYVNDSIKTEIVCRPKKVEERWHRTFNCVAKYLGFNKATRRILWKELFCGNWNRLHTTEEEDKMTSVEWLDKLCCEVFYCSDRWSLDRLARCHWLYRQYMDAAEREER